MVAYGYLLVELNFGAAFLCNLNHFIHALARFFLCIGVVCVNIIHGITSQMWVICYYCTFFPLTKQDTKCPLALDKENQTCLIGRKSTQMSKLDLLQPVMIFPFGIMNLKGSGRKYAAFGSNRPIRNPKKQFIVILLDFDLGSFTMGFGVVYWTRQIGICESHIF